MFCLFECFFPFFYFKPLVKIPKSVTESTDEMIIELFMFKSYLFSFFIAAYNHCLELIWIYHIIHFKPVSG